MKTIVITPARYDSSRFPGKPLARLGGKEIILRVMERISKSRFDAAVATDDQRIYDTVTAAGFTAIMTSKNHKSGTDRVREALDKIELSTGIRYDVVINVQGDEPFIDVNQICLLNQCFVDPTVDIATLARPFPSSSSFDSLNDPNLVKLIKSPSGKAIYFSRNVIPFIRSVEKSQWPLHHQFFTHIGIYGYRADALRQITTLPQSDLEKAESLEQLRWLEAGLSIKVEESISNNIGIDTPADLEEAERYLSENL